MCKLVVGDYNNNNNNNKNNMTGLRETNEQTQP
jgi:hypothetical protein